MCLLVTVGAWTTVGRREQKPGLHLELNLKTVTHQVTLQCRAALVLLHVNLSGHELNNGSHNNIVYIHQPVVSR